MINRCGFNSDGLRAVQQRLKKRQASPMNGRAGLLGINVGKNKLSEVSTMSVSEDGFVLMWANLQVYKFTRFELK